MKVVWTKMAEKDLADIFSYIAQEDMESAIRMDKHFRKAAANLKSFPFLGAIGRMEKTREYLIHPHYWLIYRIKGEEIQILRLLHTSRKYP